MCTRFRHTMSALREAATTAVKTATRSSRIKRQAMEVSEAAAARIKELLTTKDKPYLKIGVRTRGCNGMTYTMNYASDEDKGKFDEVVEQNGVKAGGLTGTPTRFPAQLQLNSNSEPPLNVRKCEAPNFKGSSDNRHKWHKQCFKIN